MTKEAAKEESVSKRPMSVGGSFDVLQEMCKGLCPRLAPQPMLIASVCSLTHTSLAPLLPTLRKVDSSIHVDFFSLLLSGELRYTDSQPHPPKRGRENTTEANEEEKTGRKDCKQVVLASREDIIRKLLDSSAGCCRGCQEADDLLVALAEVKFDFSHRTLWVEGIMCVCLECYKIANLFICLQVATDSLISPSKSKRDAIAALTARFLKANGKDMADSYLLQQALDAAYAMHILAKEASAWTYRTAHCSAESLVDEAIRRSQSPFS